MDEVCPNCGAFDVLDDFTGWCAKCTGNTVNQCVRRCVRCSTSFVSANGDFICHACKEEDWANEIEHLMASQNVSFSRARQLVAISNQAVCLCCGDVIPRATKGRHLFCSKKKCKSASRRLKHLRLDKGMSHAEALTKILTELSQKEEAA